jgi:hypothetical protein
MHSWGRRGRDRMALDTPVSSTNKTDRHDITEILLKVALKPPLNMHSICYCTNYNIVQIGLANSFSKQSEHLEDRPFP